MTAAGPATLDRIRRHLVGLRMPRSLEVLEHLLRGLERGELSAHEAIDRLLDEELSLREGCRVKAALKMCRLLNIKPAAEHQDAGRVRRRSAAYPRHADGAADQRR